MFSIYSKAGVSFVVFFQPISLTLFHDLFEVGLMIMKERKKRLMVLDENNTTRAKSDQQR